VFRRVTPVALTVSALATLAACAPTIGVEAAPDAADPVCADVMLALPETLADDLPKVETTSQATAAWGEPGAAVTLRCGVTPPGPSPDCQRVESAAGTVDWIVATDGDGTWRFTTYGREPAIEVVAPPAVTADHSTAFVADLAQAVSHVEQTKQCT
jgi:hypothetical protein